MAVAGLNINAVLSRLAGRQKGAVSREQLLAAGLTRHMIQRLVANRRLLPVHDGVYLVADTVRSSLAYEAAAILACQPRALLSHMTAGGLQQLPVPPPGLIEVTVVGRYRKSPEGVQVHFIKHVEPAEVTKHEGIPTTSPSLTILDIAADLKATELEAVLNEARVQRLVTDSSLRATLDAHPRRRGARALRTVIAAERGPRTTHSEAERRALAVMRAHGLEPDATQHRVGPYRLDFYFEAERLAVEFDSRQFHDTPKRFVDDRRRTAFLAARNIQVFPLTWNDLGPNAATAMSDLRAALAQRRDLLGSR